MKALNLTTLILIIVAGLNLGISGIANVDVLSMIFGGMGAMATRVVFVILGLSALWQLVPLVQAFGMGEIASERHSGA